MQSAPRLDRIGRTAAAVLPLGADPGDVASAVLRLRRATPTVMLLILEVICLLVWMLATVARRGEATRAAAVAAWVGVMARSRVPALHSLGLWLKTVGCLTELSAPAARRAVYERRRVTPPASTAVIASEMVPSRVPAETEPADQADVIVVGSGPAGATVARTLAQAGRSVLLLEEGPAVPFASGADDTLEILASRFRMGGMMTTTGPERIPVLQGRCVGGSSTINSAIVWRAPDEVFAAWHADPGLAEHLSHKRLDQAYTAVEKAINIERTAEKVYGASNALMDRGARALKIAAGPTDRYTRDCVGLGRCGEGCPLGRKLSMNATFVPDAVAAGARLYADCRVEQVEFDGDRAVGVRARWRGRRVRFGAGQAVVLAAAVVHTPLLLRASGLRHPQLGRRFQAHPGGSMVGLFDAPVREMLGATQGFDSTEYKAQGFKLETLTLGDELTATRLPGVGAALEQALADLPFVALWAVQFRAQTQGRVGGRLGMPVIGFPFSARDRGVLGSGLTALGELFFAAGAREVIPNIVGFPPRVRSMDELKGLADGVRPSQLAMIMSHLFGTTVMGSDPRAHVCDPFGRVHGVRGLVVADSSLFPTNLGVNPQHTVMAVAQHVAWGLVDHRD